MACNEETWSDVSRDVSRGGQSDRSLSYAELHAELAPDAGAEQLTAEGEDEGEGCMPYTDEVIELAGHSDDFPRPGPDVALTWRPEEAGFYVATLTSTGDHEAGLYLLGGDCEGSPISPMQGLFGAWSGFTFAAQPDQDYTFVIEGDAEVSTVQLAITLGCEQVDDSHCVLGDEDGEPACGVRYTLDAFTDQATCMPMHAPGELDAECPGTEWRGKPVKGCCQPDGACGHFDETLGCHDLAQHEGGWSPSCEPDSD